MSTVLTWALACVMVDGHLTATDVPEAIGGPVPTDEEPRTLPPPAVAVWAIEEDGEETEESGAPGDQLFAEHVIHEVAITLSDEAFRSLRDDPDEQVEGVFTWRDVDYTAGIKLKGSSSFRSIREKAAFKVDVHQYDLEQRIDGLKRLTLNNMVQDGTMVREHAYYWLGARLSVPTPRHGYARLTVNGELYGLYGLVETADASRIGRLFPGDPNGNLYESSGSDFTHARNWFDIKVDGGVVPTPDDIDDLVDTLEDADGDDLLEVLGERFDAEAVLRYLALDMVTGNSDGYVFNHHNYHAYHLADAGRWVLIPWGTDRAFTKEVSPYGNSEKPVAGVLARRCWDDEDCTDALHERIREALQLWEEGGFREMLAETLALVRDACEADPRREKDCDTEEFEAYMEDRVAYVRSEIE